MSTFCFFLLSTLMILGSRIFVNAQNCAIPSSITFSEGDDYARVENATIGTVLGTIQTLNVLGIRPLSNNKDDFLYFHFENVSSEIQLILKRLLKNELDDKNKKEIGCIAQLDCADGNTKEVVFNVEMRDHNTKCPQFEFSEYNYTINLDALGSILKTEDMIELSPSIIITDEDRDFVNADVNVTYETQFKNFQIRKSVYTQSHSFEDDDEDDHEFEVTLSVERNQVYDQRSMQRILLRVSNIEPIADPNLHCAEDPRTIAKVFIHFESNETKPDPNPEPHLVGPPEFASFYYYAVIKNLKEGIKGNTLDGIIQPSMINASDPDEIHTVTYRILEDNTRGILENRNGGILDVDPFNGTMFFKRDLTEDYVNSLKHNDYTEVYRIEAYIAETWLKPSMQFSHVPLFVLYEINSGNNTECTTPIPTDAPTVPPTQELSTTPYTTPISTASTWDPIDTTTTTESTGTTTITNPIDTTTTESSGNTTTTEPIDTSTTTESTGITTTTKPIDTTTTTESTGNTTTTDPIDTTTTTETTGGSTTTTESTGENTTTTESTGTTTTTESTATTTTMGSTGTTYTTEPTGTTNTTEPTGTTNTTDPTGTDVTSGPEIPTTSMWTTSQPSTTTEIPSTTPKPECPICSTKTAAFYCSQEGIFDDPHLCNVFHQCVLVNSTLISYRQRCPPYTGFNVTSKSCQYPPKCHCSQTEINYIRNSYTDADELPNLKEETVGKFNRYGYGDEDVVPIPGKNCTDNCTCGVCSEVLPGESVCDGTSMLYADPHSCSVYHSCRPDDRGGYIDCLMPCPHNLLFCPIRKVCNHPWAVDCPRNQQTSGNQTFLFDPNQLKF